MIAEQGCHSPRHGSGAELRTTAVTNGAHLGPSTHLTSKTRTTTTVLPLIVGEYSTGDAIKTRNVGSRTSRTSRTM